MQSQSTTPLTRYLKTARLLASKASASSAAAPLRFSYFAILQMNKVKNSKCKICAKQEDNALSLELPLEFDCEKAIKFANK